MFNVKKIQKRPNSSIPFFHEFHTHSSEYRDYFKEKYVKTKKWLSSNSYLSEDQLEMTSITSWNSQDDFIDFVSDEYIIENSILKNQKYDEEHHIGSLYESEEL